MIQGFQEKLVTSSLRPPVTPLSVVPLACEEALLFGFHLNTQTPIVPSAAAYVKSY